MPGQSFARKARCRRPRERPGRRWPTRPPPTSSRGVSYQATSRGIAFGIIARLAVIGTEPALHSVVDTTAGGQALAHAPNYAKLQASAPAGALGHVYLDPTALAGAKQAVT